MGNQRINNKDIQISRRAFYKQIFSKVRFSEIEPIEILRHGMTIRSVVDCLRKKCGLSISIEKLDEMCCKNSIPYEKIRKPGIRGFAYVFHPTTVDELAEAIVEVVEAHKNKWSLLNAKQQPFKNNCIESKETKLTNVELDILSRIGGIKSAIQKMSERIKTVENELQNNSGNNTFDDSRLWDAVKTIADQTVENIQAIGNIAEWINKNFDTSFTFDEKGTLTERISQ